MNNEKMRKLVLASFVFLFLNGFTFGQDTSSIITLKPISEFKIIHMPSLEEGRILNDKRQDSIYNCEACRIIRNDYDALKKHNSAKIDSAEMIVKRLNKKNNGYYYYIIIECNPGKFDRKNCYPSNYNVMYSSSDIHCDYFDIEIGKKGKSKIIFDGPSGEVWYYEDLNRIPN
jgi:hypothetical protein